MNKILLLTIIFLLYAVTQASDSTAVFKSDSMNSKLSTENGTGKDVKRYVVFDETANTSDSLATTDQLVIGPYPLTDDRNQNQYQYFNLIGKGLLSADSAAVFYQLTGDPVITDTTRTWTAFDTVCYHGGPRQVVVNLATKSGSYLWLRFDNYTAGAVPMCKKLYLYLRRK